MWARMRGVAGTVSDGGESCFVVMLCIDLIAYRSRFEIAMAEGW